jgi:hypothetical protein
MERRSAILPGESLQEKQAAIRREPPSLESGQDTTEYVLIIILFALSFTAGMMVWTRSVEGAYNKASECIASSVDPENGPSGTPLARGGGHHENDGTRIDRPRRRCRTVR